MAFQPVKILGIAVDEVGSPRNDGSRGSALYSVPFRLSRALATDEAQLFCALWDSPPSYSGMHRPGIGQVDGDRFVLTATSMDEVERYHASTLRLVVDEFNRRMEKQRASEQAASEEAVAAEAEHRRIVNDIAQRVRFDD